MRRDVAHFFWNVMKYQVECYSIYPCTVGCSRRRKTPPFDRAVPKDLIAEFRSTRWKFYEVFISQSVEICDAELYLDLNL